MAGGVLRARKSTDFSDTEKVRPRSQMLTNFHRNITTQDEVTEWSMSCSTSHLDPGDFQTSDGSSGMVRP